MRVGADRGEGRYKGRRYYDRLGEGKEFLFGEGNKEAHCEDERDEKCSHGPSNPPTPPFLLCQHQDSPDDFCR